LQDAEALARQEQERVQRSGELAAEYVARLTLAETVAALQQVGNELTAAVKRRLVHKDLERVRRAYADRLAKLRRPRIESAAGDGNNEPGEEGVPADRSPAIKETEPSGA
jgi:hypothetical protein